MHMYEQDGQFFQYKGKPLVRSGNVIYYGSMMDDYVVMLQIKSTKEEAGRKLPDQIVVQLMRTDKNVKPQDVVVKKADKSGLYNALDVADIWLRRSLSEQQ
jgi:arginyl-tRNA synthetase